jgi:hypothetical protein
MRESPDSEADFGLLKIGITRGDVLHRVASLQTGNPYDLFCVESFETPWPREVEHFMHRTHAADMQQTEWLRCGRNDLRTLVAEAREAARQIEERKSKEQGYTSRPSNGQVRRATLEEFQLHADARKVMKELVPAQLRLTIAENRLKAATGATFGIPGIVRVKHVPATFRFSARLAESQFPELAFNCREDTISGAFRWRKMPQPFHFIADNQAARAEELAAQTAADDVLQRNVSLEGWIDRSRETERWHDDFLQATPAVYNLGAELAVLQTELTVRLGDYDALDGVCSFKRSAVSKLDRAAFRRNFPDESERCARHVGPRLRKYVYTTRSYV